MELTTMVVEDTIEIVETMVTIDIKVVKTSEEEDGEGNMTGASWIGYVQGSTSISECVAVSVALWDEATGVECVGCVPRSTCRTADGDIWNVAFR